MATPADGQDRVDRAIQLSGAFNCRDLGGMTTRDGRMVAPGRILRSDSVAGLDGSSIKYLLDTFGLSNVIDLRTAAEADADGQPMRDVGVNYLNSPILLHESTRVDEIPTVTSDSLAATYFAYLRPSARSIVAILKSLANEGGTPALIHCTAGKDRTGVVVAILLELLNVERAQVVADYVETHANMSAVRARINAGSSIYSQHLAGLPEWIWHADARTMERFLDEVDTIFGGVESWALGIGLERRIIDRLRKKLLIVP